MLATPIATPVTQAVWTLLQQSGARALDYDLRLQLSGDAQTAALALDRTVATILSARVGSDVRKRELTVAALPGPL